MESLSKRIMQHARSLAVATPICAGALPHLGNRAAVDKALSRLARSGNLLRVCHGVYMKPVETRFGTYAPSVSKAVDALAGLWGEAIVPSGGAAAHLLGLTTQMPIRPVYLTLGPSHWLQFGSLTVELRHTPRWQLVAPNRRAGEVIRAMAWLGPEELLKGLEKVLPGLSPQEVGELADARATMPHWMAEQVSKVAANG